MNKILTLFTPTDEIVPLQELEELSGLETIDLLEQQPDVEAGYRLRWGDVVLEVAFLREDLRDDLLNQFQLQVDELLEDRTDRKAKKIWRRAERMVNAIRCTVTPDWDSDRQAQYAVQGVMAYFDYALMYAEETIYNENGNIEVGHEESRPKYWFRADEIIESDEASKRKKQSIKHLKAAGIPTIDHLPVIPDSSQTSLREIEDIAARAIVLYLIARYAFGESDQWFQEQITKLQLDVYLTEDERSFVADGDPADYVQAKFQHRSHSCRVLLWALGYMALPDKPGEMPDMSVLSAFFEAHSLSTVIEGATPRTFEEVLDQADLAYRYHWAVVDADLYGKKPPAGLRPAPAYEQHYAFNWLIQYQGQGWDQVSTDT